MRKTLVVVEAKGKIPHLERLLKQMGMPATVMATLGHIATNPSSLRPIAMTPELKETDYRLNPAKVHLVDAIQRAAFGAERIYLAMDDDQEGDVIAADLARELSDCANRIQRVRLRAITEVELAQAFANASSGDLSIPGNNGACRRIVDRAIGAIFSDFDERQPIYTGRVQSSMLAALAMESPELGRFVLEGQVASGDVIQASVPVYSLADIQHLDSVQDMLDKGQGRPVRSEVLDVPASVPWGYDEVVFECSRRLGLGIEETAEGFQEAYERGKVSYPRIRANGFTEEGVALVASLAKHNRAAFDGSVLPRRDQWMGGCPHETPRPMDDEMQLGRALSVLDTPDAIAVLIARNVIECGQVSRVRRLQVQVGADNLMFCTVPVPHRKPWRVSSQRGFSEFTMEQSLLKFMAERQLGRPSTLVTHVKKFLRRDLVVGRGDSPFSLTDKGERWLEHARMVGLNARTSYRMELRFAEAISDPSQAARDILREHGLLGRVQEGIECAMAAGPQNEDESQEFGI